MGSKHVTSGKIRESSIEWLAPESNLEEDIKAKEEMRRKTWKQKGKTRSWRKLVVQVTVEHRVWISR